MNKNISNLHEQQYIVNSEYNDSRLDKWYRKNISSLPQALIEKYLRNRLIKLNNSKTQANARIREGDVITIKSSLIEEEKKYIASIPEHYVDLIKNNILYEDANIIVINKPAGLAVQGGSKVAISIDDILPHLAQDQLRLVHRLDKETSGILILARHNQAAELLSSGFRAQKIKKTYLAILTKNLPQNKGCIENKLAKIRHGNVEKVMAHENGQPAITKYELIQKYGANHCLVKLNPITGRTHQLRAHMAGLGCPILGDRKYGTHTSEKNLYLHAAKIEINNIFDKNIILEVGCPSYFEEVLIKLC